MAEERTVSSVVAVQTEVKHSRFIAELVPFSDFETRLAALKTEHPKANHHVTASRWRNPENQVIESAKDDGEPSGSSGMPCLKVLIGNQLMDVAVVVVRYFGGVKLGVGGLSRAYADAVGQAIKAADEAGALIVWQRIIEIEARRSFAEASELERWISANAVVVITRDYDETDVIFRLSGPEELLSSLSQSLENR